MKLIKFYLLFLLLPTMASAAWHPAVLKKININQKSQYTYVKFTNKKINKTFYVNAVILKQHQYSAKVINHHLSFSQFFKSRVYATTKAAHAFLGINGAYFKPDFTPLGLVIIHGRQLSELSQARLLSGLIIINSTGQVAIKYRRAHYKGAHFALQAGPFLIRPSGKIIMRHRGPAERRTAIALTKEKNLLVLSTTPVSLYDLAFAIKDNPKTFGANHISTALNLDGGTSTAMTLLIPHHRAIVIPEFFPVKNVLVFYLR